MRQVHGGGIGAPKNTPAEIVTRLNQEINAGLAGAEGQTRFAAFGVSVFLSSVADFRQFIADETEKWAKVVKFTGIRADWSENFYHSLGGPCKTSTSPAAYKGAGIKAE